MLMNLDRYRLTLYLSRFININMNVGNAKMTYIVKRRREYYSNDRFTTSFFILDLKLVKIIPCNFSKKRLYHVIKLYMSHVNFTHQNIIL